MTNILRYLRYQKILQHSSVK